MKVALVASSYLPRLGALERHVDQLAQALARQGVDVEVLAQAAVRGVKAVEHRDGVIVRRFRTVVGSRRFPVAPGLWDALRREAHAFDLVDVHTLEPHLAFVASRCGFGRAVLTPHISIEHLLRRPHGPMTRLAFGRAGRIVCTSAIECQRLRESLPAVAERVRHIPSGLDITAIDGAGTVVGSGAVVLAVGALAKGKGLERAVAAMAALGPEFRLVVVGDGPLRQKLRRRAHDLRVADRVQFTGPIPDRELYQWLRAARVALALCEQHDSGTRVSEALAAGAAVVASDTPAHREAAQRIGGNVVFVAAPGSPLDVADAVTHAAALHSSLPRLSRMSGRSWDLMAQSVWELYQELVVGTPTPEREAGAVRLSFPAGARNGRLPAPDSEQVSVEA